MILLFANNAKTTLAAAINSTVTTLTVFPGTGLEFPQPTSGQYFKATLVDALTGNNHEIIHVTNVTTDTFTIVRGQEGTTAQAWLTGDFVANFDTAGTEATFVQPDQYQQGTYSYGVASGTVNALTVTIPSQLTSPPDGMPLTLKASGMNTTTVTLTLTLGSTVQSSVAIVKGANQSLIGGDIPAAGYPINLNWSQTFNAWVMQNPATGANVLPVGAIFQFPALTVPTGFLLLDGSLISRSTYAALWAFAQTSNNLVSDSTWLAGQIGSFSSGDGSTTFRIPKFLGYFIRCLDTSDVIDPGRTIGTIQLSQNLNHTHPVSSVSSSSSSSTVIDNGHAHAWGVKLQGLWNGGSQQFLGNGNAIFSGGGASNLGVGGSPYPTSTDSANISVTTGTTTTTTSSIVSSGGGDEARPINLPLLTCIKY